MNGRVPRATIDPKDRPVVRGDRSSGQPLAPTKRSDEQESQGQDQSLDLALDAEDQLLVRAWLRAAIDESDEQWKDAAVAAHIGLKGESGANYFSKMLRGEKPISAKHLRSLPNDIQRRYAQKHAEHLGLIVVTPLHGDDAIKALLGALAGVLSPLMSVKPRMVRAALAVRPERRRA